MLHVLLSSYKSFIDSLSFTGRVHSAMITAVDLEKRNVTVEWFEKGDVKGKEVKLLTCVTIKQGFQNINYRPKHITSH